MRGEDLSLLWRWQSELLYRWRTAYRQLGEAGLVNAKPIPKNPVNRTSPEIVDKVLHLRRTYHLGPIRIVWSLARYHAIKISEAGVSRILRRNGVSRLPRGTRLRKIHTKRYNKQVPGHHIHMDVKFLTFDGPRGEKIRRFQYTCPRRRQIVPDGGVKVYQSG